MALVTVRIPGSEDVTIVGKVWNPSSVAPVIPVSIGSVANSDVDPQAEVVDPKCELSVDIPVGNVKDLIKKFEPVEMCEKVDTLAVDDSSDDMMCDLAKLA